MVRRVDAMRGTLFLPKARGIPNSKARKASLRSSSR